MPLPTHERFPFSPLPSRADYSWPGDKRLALYVALNVETFGYGMPAAVLGAAPPPPDHRNWPWREYGNRTGFWRLLDLFDEMELPVAHLVNAYLYETHPEIPAAIRKRGDEFVGHGRTNSERVGGRPGEAGDDVALAQAAYLLRIGFHHGIAEADLAVAGDDDLAVLADRQNGGAVPDRGPGGGGRGRII